MTRKMMAIFLFLLGFCSTAFAQSPPAQQPKTSQAAAAKEEAAQPSAEFLAGYDEFIVLGKARASAEKKRAEYAVAVKVLAEQQDELGAKLRAEMARVAPGYQFDPAKRVFVALPPPAPAKDAEKKP